ncbi:MAG: GSCFA domain-containing protein [Planctomycetes bacterium]|nr:GSCFA domain-containing protein [Planctomycetota bacterium]
MNAIDYYDRFPKFRHWPTEPRPLKVMPNPLVDFDTPLITIGSCFAENILIRLESLDFNVMDPCWGYKYSTRSVLRELKNTLEKRLTTQDYLYKGNMGYTDLNHHRIYDES